MDEEKKNNIKNTTATVAEISANVAGIWFPHIPIIASVILSIKETIDRRQLDKRLNCIEKSISELEKNIYHKSPSQVTSFFTSQISGLNSHDYYSFRRNIRFLIADAQPEVVDTFVSALLHFLHDEDVRHSMDEEVMDILLQFNAHDIDLMERIELYRNSRYKIEDAKEKNEDDKTITVIMGFKWEEFAEFLGYKDKKLRDALTEGTYKQENGEYSFDFAYLGRVLLKLQSLGVFDLAFKMYFGSSSVMDIENVTITQFGNEILKHIAYAKGWPQRIVAGDYASAKEEITRC